MEDTDTFVPQERPAPAEKAAVETLLAETTQHEGYFQLVWRRFLKSKPAIVGRLLVIGLAIMAILADFFSPYALDEAILENSFIPPTQVHLVDAQGKLHLRPFVYALGFTVDMKTFVATWTEDTTKIYPVSFFVKGSAYKILGVIPSDRHLFGVAQGGAIHLLGTDKLGPVSYTHLRAHETVLDLVCR